MESQQEQQDELLPRLRGVYGVERLGGGPRQQQQQQSLRSATAAGRGLGVLSKPLLQPRKPWVSWQQQQQNQQQQCQQLQHRCQQQQQPQEQLHQRLYAPFSHQREHAPQHHQQGQQQEQQDWVVVPERETATTQTVRELQQQHEQERIHDSQQQENQQNRQQEKELERRTEQEVGLNPQLIRCRLLSQEGSDDFSPPQAAHATAFLRSSSFDQEEAGRHQHKADRIGDTSSYSAAAASCSRTAAAACDDACACSVTQGQGGRGARAPHCEAPAAGFLRQHQQQTFLQRSIQQQNLWQRDDHEPHGLPSEQELQQHLEAQKRQRSTVLENERNLLQQSVRHPQLQPLQQNLQQRKETLLQQQQQPWEQRCCSPHGHVEPSAVFLLPQREPQGLVHSTRQQHTQQPPQAHTQQDQPHLHTFQPSCRQQRHQQVDTVLQRGGENQPLLRESEYSLFLRQMQQHEALLRRRSLPSQAAQHLQHRALREIERQQLLGGTHHQVERRQPRDATWLQQQGPQRRAVAPALPSLPPAAAPTPHQLPELLLQQLPHCTLFKQLSDEQRAVVFAPFNADICVIAGPGSGKTRVLAARVALLLLLQPAPVLALTFTRRGAEEMRQRIIVAVYSIAAAIAATSRAQGSSPPTGALCAAAPPNNNGNSAPIPPGAAGPAAAQGLEPRRRLSAAPCAAASSAAAAAATRFHSPSAAWGSAALTEAGGGGGQGVSSHSQAPLPEKLLSPNQQQRLLLSLKTGRVSVCTFHKFCLQFLRQHASKHLHIDSNFRIATPSEQVRLARTVILRFRQRLLDSASGRGPSAAAALSATSATASLHFGAAPLPSSAAAACLPVAARAVNLTDPAAASTLLVNKNLEAALSRARTCAYVVSHKTKSPALQRQQVQQQSQPTMQTRQSQVPQQQQHAMLSEEEEDELSACGSEEESDDSVGEGYGEAAAGGGGNSAATQGKGRTGAKAGGGSPQDVMNSNNGGARDKGGWTEAEELLKLVRRCKKRGCMAVMPGRRWLERSRAKQSQQQEQRLGGWGGDDTAGGSCCYSAAAEEWWQKLQREHWPAALLVEEYHHVLLSQKPPLLDHSDLIRCTLLLLDWNSAVPKQAARRYPFILVDEFQDTSKEQLRILQLLRTGAAAAATDSSPAASIAASGTAELSASLIKQQQQGEGGGGIMVVGDDDQSIYSFRGIDAKNFVLFEQAYPHALELHLSQNYRCSPAIVSSSAALIAHNTRRRPKQLRAAQLPAPPRAAAESAAPAAIPGHPPTGGPTVARAGEAAVPGFLPPVLCALLSSPRAEAQYILRFILAVKQHRRLCWCDFAILSRTNRALKEIEALLADPAILRAASCPGILPYCSALPALPSAAAAGPSSSQPSTTGPGPHRCAASAPAAAVVCEGAASASLSSSGVPAPAATSTSATSVNAAAGAGVATNAACASSTVAAGRAGKHQRRQNMECCYTAERPPDPALLLGRRWGLLTFPKDIPLRSTAATKLLCGQQLLRRTDTLHCLVYLRLAIDLDHDWSFIKALQLKRIKGVGPAVLKKLDEMLDAAVPPDKRTRSRCNSSGVLGTGRRRKRGTAAASEGAQPEASEGGNPLGDNLKQLQLQQEPRPHSAAATEGPHSLFRCLCCVVDNATTVYHSSSSSNARGGPREKRVKRDVGAAVAERKVQDIHSAAATCKPAAPWATQQHASGGAECQQQEATAESKSLRRSSTGNMQHFTKHTVEQLQRMHQELSQLHALTKQQVSAADVLRFILVDLGVEAHIARCSAAARRKVTTRSKSDSTPSTTFSSCCSTSSSPDSNSSSSMNSSSNTRNSSSASGELPNEASFPATCLANSGGSAGASVKPTKKRYKQSVPADNKETEAAQVGSAALHDKLEQVWSLLRTAEAYTPNAAEPLGWHCVKRFLLDISNDFCSGVHPLQHQQHATRDAVILSTIHQAKGLEWPVVILCRAHEG